MRCLFSGDMYASFGITSSVFEEVLVFETFWDKVLVILPVILLPIKSPVASALFGLLSLKLL